MQCPTRTAGGSTASHHALSWSNNQMQIHRVESDTWKQANVEANIHFRGNPMAQLSNKKKSLQCQNTPLWWTDSWNNLQTVFVTGLEGGEARKYHFLRRSHYTLDQMHVPLYNPPRWIFTPIPKQSVYLADTPYIKHCETPTRRRQATHQGTLQHASSADWCWFRDTLISVPLS